MIKNQQQCDNAVFRDTQQSPHPSPLNKGSDEGSMNAKKVSNISPTTSPQQLFQLELKKNKVNMRTIDKLLEGGVNQSQFGRIKPLCTAAEHGHTEAIEAMVKAGFKVNGYNNPFDYSPLMTACYFNQKDAAEILINKGANLDAQNLKGETALFISGQLTFGDRSLTPQIFDLLLKNQASVNIENKDNETPLYVSSQKVLANDSSIILEDMHSNDDVRWFFIFTSTF